MLKSSEEWCETL